MGENKYPRQRSDAEWQSELTPSSIGSAVRKGPSVRTPVSMISTLLPVSISAYAAVKNYSFQIPNLMPVVAGRVLISRPMKAVSVRTVTCLTA